MTFTATIFTNLTPNSDRGLYYAPSGKFSKGAWGDSYLTHLKSICDNSGGEMLYNEFELYNYNFTENYIDIDSQLNALVNIPTYVGIKSSTGMVSFYFVSDIIPIANGYRLIIDLDQWGTYIGAAEITKINFTRSNIELNPNAYLQYTTPAIETFYETIDKHIGCLNATRAQLRIVAAIQYTAFKQIRSYEIERVELFEFNPHDIAAGDVVSETEFKEFLNRVANIYATNFSSQDLGTATLKSLYIVPQPLNKETYAVEFNTVKTSGGVEKVSITGVKVSEGIQDITVTLFNGNNPSTDFPKAVKGDYVGYKSTFGTQYDGVGLPTFVGYCQCVLRIEQKTDGLRFLAKCGTQERDITSDFSVTTVANTGTLNSLEQISKWIGIASNIGAGVTQIVGGGAAIATGAGAGAGIASIASGSLQLANTLVNLDDNRNGTYIGSGNGLTTFGDVIHNSVAPYLYWTIAGGAVFNNACNVKKFGAICEYDYPDENAYLFTIIFNKPFLLSNTPNIAIACEATVDGIPSAAADEIQTILSNGVSLNLIDE